MYYKPKDGILFPEHKYELRMVFGNCDHSVCYAPEDPEKIFNELKNVNSIVEVEPGVIVNTRHIASCEILTLIRDEREHWRMLDKKILGFLISNEGQEALLKNMMKVDRVLEEELSFKKFYPKEY